MKIWKRPNHPGPVPVGFVATDVTSTQKRHNHLFGNKVITLFLHKVEGLIETGLDSIVYFQIPFFKGNPLNLDGLPDAIAVGVLPNCLRNISGDPPRSRVFSLL